MRGADIPSRFARPALLSRALLRGGCRRSEPAAEELVELFGGRHRAGAPLRVAGGHAVDLSGGGRGVRVLGGAAVACRCAHLGCRRPVRVPAQRAAAPVMGAGRAVGPTEAARAALVSAGVTVVQERRVWLGPDGVRLERPLEAPWAAPRDLFAAWRRAEWGAGWAAAGRTSPPGLPTWMLPGGSSDGRGRPTAMGRALAGASGRKHYEGSLVSRARGAQSARPSYLPTQAATSLVGAGAEVTGQTRSHSSIGRHMYTYSRQPLG